MIKMAFIFDWFLIIISTTITWKSYTQIIFNKKSSVAYLVICVIYIFCCIPIFLNYFIGVPDYTVIYWYKPFIVSMNNFKVAIVYDIYISISILLLYYYAVKSTRKLSVIYSQNFKMLDKKNIFVCILGIISPFIYGIFSGNISKLFVYNSMSARGINVKEGFILNSFILISLFFGCVLNLKGKITVKKILSIFLLSVVLCWLQGKRFIIAVILIFYLFFLSKSDISLKKRKILYRVLPIIGTLLITFSIFYLATLKPLSTMDFYSIYDMLRVDYGRDDVIKFVIYEEFFLKSHILDYPGQSFFSTLFVFIPRTLWNSKQYGHYQYLTSAILDLPINKLPAGTTPCWYEMCLCNFGYVGFVIGIVGIIGFCYWADKMKLIEAKALVFILILVLLTQNTDVYIVYIFMTFIYCFLQCNKISKFYK